MNRMFLGLWRLCSFIPLELSLARWTFPKFRNEAAPQDEIRDFPFPFTGHRDPTQPAIVSFYLVT